MYPNYSARGDLPKEKVRDITHRVRDLFTAKFSGVILNSADTLVISSFLGLIPLALFQNYFYIINALRGILYVFLAACKGGIGNSLVTESVDKNYYDLRKLSFMFNWIISLASTMLLCLYQPFMSIWMGEDYLLSISCMFCFVLYLYVYEINRLITLYKDAAGIWHKDRFRPLVASLVNLGLNLATVQWLGLYGVVLSTVVSVVFIEIPWLLHNLFHEVFPKEKLWKYLGDLAKYVGATAVSFAAAWYLCSLHHTGKWASLVINAAVSFIVCNLVFFLLFSRTKLFKDSTRILKKTFLKKKVSA
jgi:O-antigen/teichoic acid export membrane protein